MKVNVQTTIKTPRVPNFVQCADGKWLPLCSLEKSDLKALALEWLASLEKRYDEQSKDKKFFTEKASTGGA